MAKKKKPSLNLKKINKVYLIIALLSVIFFLVYRRYFLFVVLSIGSGVFSYYHSKVNRTPIDFKLVLFLSIYITRYYGILFTLIFFIFSDLIPTFLAGASVNSSTVIFSVWLFIVNSFVYAFPSTPLIILGPILVIVEATGSFFINKFFGIPDIMSLFASALAILVRIIYFLTLGKALDILFSVIA